MSGTARRADQPEAAGEPLRLIVELALDGEPIHGSISDSGGARPFAGWIELTAALEDARARAASPRTAPPVEAEPQ